MKNKLIRLITILLSVSIFTTSFSLQISASETISGVVIQNEWEYELKDDIMTWTFLKDDSDIVMTIENGVCNVDGNIISINIFDWNEPDNSESNFVFDWMNKNPIKEINFSDNVTKIHYGFQLGIFIMQPKFLLERIFNQLVIMLLYLLRYKT